MSELTREQDQAEMSKRVAAIYEAVNFAQEWAEAIGLCFSLDIEYGMGGYYDPNDTCDYTGTSWFPSFTGC